MPEKVKNAPTVRRMPIYLHRLLQLAQEGKESISTTDLAKALDLDLIVVRKDISLTGIAGPGGGTPDKPVGLVYCGVKCCDKTEILEFRLTRSREQIRERAAAKALDHLRRMLLKMC